jgi:hypothetical protein
MTANDVAVAAVAKDKEKEVEEEAAGRVFLYWYTQCCLLWLTLSALPLLYDVSLPYNFNLASLVFSTSLLPDPPSLLSSSWEKKKGTVFVASKVVDS